MIIMIISFTNVYSQIKQVRLKPLSKPISQPGTSSPSSYQPPPTVDYLSFFYVSSSSVKTTLSSQVDNGVLIDTFNVISRVLPWVLFLRASCCFPSEKKSRSTRLLGIPIDKKQLSTINKNANWSVFFKSFGYHSTIDKTTLLSTNYW